MDGPIVIMSSEEYFRSAIQNLRAGDTLTARELFKKAIKEDPHHVDAWMRFAGTLSTEAERIQALTWCVKYNPDSQLAREALERLQGQTSSQEISRATSPPLLILTQEKVAEKQTARLLQVQPPPVQSPPVQAASIVQASPTTDIPLPAFARQEPLPGDPQIALPDTPLAPPLPKVRPERDKPRESCLAHLGYLVLGTIILMISEAIIFGPNFLMTGSMEMELSNVPNSGLGIVLYCLSAVLALAGIIFWFYLMNEGWEAVLPYEFLKFLAMFVALFTPVGWYWMGRGAVKIFRRSFPQGVT